MKSYKNICAVVFFIMPCCVLAQTYPSKPIRFIVPNVPGGSGDVIARVLAEKLRAPLGQSVLVDNRPGAGTMIGTELAAKAAPDGYTIILSAMPHAINASIYKKVPYDPIKDFTPITLVGVTPMYLFASLAIPIKTVPELIKWAKEKPNQIAIGSGGNGSTTHLAAVLFQARTGVALTHTPYKGTGPALIDLVAARIPVAFTSMAAAAPFVKSGKINVLAIASAKRSPLTPEVPTFDETGVRGMVVEHWPGVMAPAGVPRTIIMTLHKEIVSAINLPDMKERFDSLDIYPVTNTPQEFTDFLKSEVERWKLVVKSAGLSAE